MAGIAAGFEQGGEEVDVAPGGAAREAESVPRVVVGLHGARFHRCSAQARNPGQEEQFVAGGKREVQAGARVAVGLHAAQHGLDGAPCAGGVDQQAGPPVVVETQRLVGRAGQDRTKDKQALAERIQVDGQPAAAVPAGSAVQENEARRGPGAADQGVDAQPAVVVGAE